MKKAAGWAVTPRRGGGINKSTALTRQNNSPPPPWQLSSDLAALRRAAQQELQCQRQVEHVCQTPRLVKELLDEIGRHHGISDDIYERLARYAELDLHLLHALGGDHFPAPPIRPVGGREK